ncbi:hypothetical protein C2E23DRAFT_720185 [Lenzites betulinus]|nr:hypothetical protein C2E23DRAFT_720185 [Lenzites betulinus]
MDIHPGLQMPTVLRRCSWCGEAEKPSRRLKKCAACEYSMYCGKQCQRSAWEDHKASCRYMSHATKHIDPLFEAEVRPFGFINSTAFSRALNDWAEAHSWALQTSTQAYILKLGGIKFLKNPPLFMVCYDSVCQTTPGMTLAQRNPATTFTLNSQSVYKIDEWTSSHPTNAQYWAETAPEREMVAKSMEERCGSAFACTLCVVVKCVGVTMSNTMNFPFLHTRKRRPLDNALVDILEDVMVLCSATVNKGFPLRCLEGGDSKIPLPGKFLRRAGKWIWEPLFADWDQYSPTNKEYQAFTEALVFQRKTDLSPKQLLSAVLAL